jgi:hypothetical protein
VEESELYWIRQNQATIRADLYKGLYDALHNANADEAMDLG